MKRFTETTKWQDGWFRKLPPRLKCLWNYLCEGCDAAGVIDPDWELLSFQIGEGVTEDDLADFGENRVQKLPSGKLWITRFIEFQYGRLSKDCKAHVPIFKAIQMHNLQDALDTLSKGYSKGIQTLKETDKEKDKEKETEIKGVQGDLPAVEKSDVVAAWNAEAALPSIRSVTSDRRTALKARMSEPFFRDNFAEGIKRIAGSDFCLGKTGNWKATFDWLLQPGTLAKVLEGKYDSKAQPKTLPLRAGEQPPVWDPMEATT